MIYVILEGLKVLAWVSVLVLAIYHRRGISLNVFWLTIISGVLMVVAGVEDIAFGVLETKSIWWFIANVFVIATYFSVLRRSWRFYGATKSHVTEFLNKVEKNIEKIRFENEDK